ncbi:MAG: hypothetical protein PHX93_02175 [Candidatus Peribacteraceae bacterium]|jgi:CxxC-x17-CxxC domain-containing protein|nr:hypothetical protein [Candidatus Peribacteraceae bacterium]
MDYNSWGDKAERLYQCSACGNNAFNLKFCTTCATNNADLTYCDSCVGCHDCFGCVGLKKRQYCILNKQYTEEEFGKLRAQLIAHMQKSGEWGEYFPKEVCPFAFNETIAMEYFPIGKEEAIRRGYKWRDEVDEPLDVEKVIPAAALPDTIAEIPDDVLNWAITSQKTKRPFRITKQELEFYRTHSLPLPHLHPEERHEDRLKRRPPRRLWERTCAKCGKEVESTFQPSRPEIVYCESCYLKEVY